MSLTALMYILGGCVAMLVICIGMVTYQIIRDIMSDHKVEYKEEPKRDKFFIYTIE